MKKISFQSAHWRKWMKWDWWKLFKDSILRQNCNLGKIKCVLRLSKDFFSQECLQTYFTNKEELGETIPSFWIYRAIFSLRKNYPSLIESCILASSISWNRVPQFFFPLCYLTCRGASLWKGANLRRKKTETCIFQISKAP